MIVECESLEASLRKLALEGTSCGTCLLRNDVRTWRHCAMHELVPVIVFDRGACNEYESARPDDIARRSEGCCAVVTYNDDLEKDLWSWFFASMALVLLAVLLVVLL